MAGKNIVVEGCQFAFQAGTGQCTVDPSCLPSEVVKAEGKKCYKKQVVVQITNYVGGSVASQGTGVATIQGTATKTKIEGDVAVLEGDNVQVTISGMSSGGTPASTQDVISIQNAGQQKAKGI